ncbi:MAG: hypothetical protein ACOYB1_10395 [Limnohabitans sp.]
MSSDLTPAQRLAISRARLAEALRKPLCLLIMARWLHANAQAPRQTPPGSTH